MRGGRIPAGIWAAHQEDVTTTHTLSLQVYSFGVCLFEMWTMCAEQPYKNMAISDIFAGVITGSLRPAIPDGMDAEWASIMTDCWHSDPSARPSFTEVAERLDALLQGWRVEEEEEGGATAAMARELSRQLSPEGVLQLARQQQSQGMLLPDLNGRGSGSLPNTPVAVSSDEAQEGGKVKEGTGALGGGPQGGVDRTS